MGENTESGAPVTPHGPTQSAGPIGTTPVGIAVRTAPRHPWKGLAAPARRRGGGQAPPPGQRPLVHH
jgi:hypothetical protein